MKSVIYDNPAFWNLLWVVGVLAIIVALGVTWRRRALMKFIGSRFTGLLAPGVSLMKLRIKAWLWVLAMAALVLALVDIRWGKHMVEVQQKGVDIMFVLDVSRSMLAEDAAPNRLRRAEEYIGDMLDVMKGDRAGLIVFAGSAKQIVPLTNNYSEITMALQEAGPHSVERGGTALGDAIRIAARSFLDKTPNYKAIVIFSDGEDQDSYAVEAASTAHKDRGVKIFTVALGDAKTGARVPLQYTSEGKVYLKYYDKEVWTKMNSQLLEKVALAGGGAFVPAGTARLDMADVYYQYIDPMQEREFEQTRVSTYIPRYQWFLGVALVLFLLEAVILGRRNGGVMKFFKFARLVKSSNKTAVCIAVGFALFTCGAAKAGVSPQEVVKEANRELQAGQVDKALKTYEQLQVNEPLDAERLNYNKAVAHYRKGELEKSRTMLKQAAEQGNKPLEAMARYNIGNCFYSDAVKQAKQKKFKEGIELLDKAVAEYRKSLEANQADNDARANIELAELLKKQLREEEKKQQEQQKKDQQKNDKNKQQNKNQNQQDKQKNKEQQQNKNNQQKDQSNKDKQDKNKQDKQDKQQDKNKQQQDKNPQDQQNKDKQNQDKNQQKNQQDKEKDKSQQDKDKEKEKQKQQGEQDKQQQNQQPQQQQPQPKPGEKDEKEKQQGGGSAGQPQQAKPKELSDEEAARMLQGIRDRNLKRRIEKFRKMQVEQAPVDKDW